jgi:type III secretion protein J
VPKRFAVYVLIPLFAACGVNEIQHDLSERQANQILVLLEGAGIDAQKTRDPKAREPLYTVLVSAGDSPRALRLLVERDMPRRESRGMADTFSAAPGLIPTAMQERARLIAALSGEVEKKLRIIPGVMDAHATVVLPENDPLRDADAAPQRATASVVFRFTPSDPEESPPITDGEVKTLVAASVPGLSPNDVVVIARAGKPELYVKGGAEAAVRFAGIQVYAGSRGRLIAVLGGLLLVAVLSLGGLGVLLLRRSKTAKA